MEQCLVILFGKTGVGKNYTAEIFEKELGFYFYDADRDLTAEMKEAIAVGRVFTDTMRVGYFKIIKQKASELLESKAKIVLTQGLFKNKQRREFSEAFPFAKFIWVDADDCILEQRILRRNSSVTLEYARKINPLFETPDFSCEKIINNGEYEELLNEVRKIGTKLMLWLGIF